MGGGGYVIGRAFGAAQGRFGDILTVGDVTEVSHIGKGIVINFVVEGAVHIEGKGQLLVAEIGSEAYDPVWVRVS